MKRYDERRLYQLWHRCRTRRVVFEPFRGDSPIRLFILVLVMNPKTEKWVRRFTYNGRYSLEAIKQASRMEKFLQINPGPFRHDVRVLLMEYHRKGVIYRGNLYEGTSTYGHNFIHPNSQNHFARNTTPVTRQPDGPERFVRCGSIVVLVPEKEIPAKDDKPGWVKLRRDLVRNRRSVEEK